MVETNTFSPRGYLDLIQELRERGYEFRFFGPIDQRSPTCLLRHDVDVSLTRAIALAALEAKIGVAATYFVLVRTEAYNVLSRQGVEALNTITDLGHHIGVHFDPSLYDHDSDLELANAIRKECDIFKFAVGTQPDAVSFHRPAPSLLGKKLPVIRVPHTYDPVFFEEIGYCSDSRGAWHHGHPLQHDAVRQRLAFQLLTHPVWWVGASERTVLDCVEGVIAERADEHRQAYSEEIQSYAAALADAAGERSMNDA